MIGFVGFIAATVVFALYSLSVLNNQKHIKKGFDTATYALGYVMVSLACMSWAIAAVVDNSNYFSAAIAAGTGLLLLATVLFMTALLNKPKPILVVSILAVAVMLFAYRVVVSGISATMENSVLVFNTPVAFGVVLIALFVTVWLGASKKYYSTLLKSSRYQASLYSMFYALNILALIAVSGFLFAEKQLTIIISFSFLVLAYIALSVIGYATDKLLLEEK